MDISGMAHGGRILPGKEAGCQAPVDQWEAEEEEVDRAEAGVENNRQVVTFLGLGRYIHQTRV